MNGIGIFNSEELGDSTSKQSIGIESNEKSSRQPVLNAKSSKERDFDCGNMYAQINNVLDQKQEALFDSRTDGSEQSPLPSWNFAGIRMMMKPSWSDLEYIDVSDEIGQLCDDDDVDSRDASPIQNPIHCFRISTETPSCAIGACRVNQHEDAELFVESDVKCYHQPVFFGSSKPRLTLSAFRRPEQTIRLTNSDPSRGFALEYDLEARNCGVLGHGAFSTVRLAVRRRDGVKVAVKSIAKHEALRSRRLRFGGRSYLEEWDILQRFEYHPYVITLLDVLENDEEIQLVTEYCAGGELFDAIQKRQNRSCSKRKGQYTESQAAIITSQILSALRDLHHQNIVHRDVKPENILLANDDESSLHVKLCDFGVARPLSVINDPSASDTENYDESAVDGEASPLTPGRSRSFSTIGTDYYAAPEIVFGGTYNTAVDIYSLGVVLYILLCGFPPVFSGEDSDEIIFPSSYWTDVSNDAKNLLRKMLHADASERISAEEALKDKWIVDNNPTYRSSVKSVLPITSKPEQRRSNGSTYDRSSPIDLEMVRSQLMKNIETLNSPDSPASKKSPPSTSSASHSNPSKKRVLQLSPDGRRPSIGFRTSPSPMKRTRYERRVSSAFLALADLYRDVSTTQTGIYAATAAAVSSPQLTQGLDVAADSVLVDELTAEQHEHSIKLAALSF